MAARPSCDSCGIKTRTLESDFFAVSVQRQVNIERAGGQPSHVFYTNPTDRMAQRSLGNVFVLPKCLFTFRHLLSGLAHVVESKQGGFRQATCKITAFLSLLLAEGLRAIYETSAQIRRLLSIATARFLH